MYDRAARIALAFARFLMRKTRDSRFDLFPLSLDLRSSRSSAFQEHPKSRSRLY
jgi:hypothetical protein